MGRLLWQLRSLHRHLVWPIVLAVVLLVTNAIFYLERVLPLAAEATKLAEDNSRLRRIGNVPAANETPLSSAEQLAAFYAFFPNEDVQSDVLDRVFAAATKENLALPQGEYSWTREPAGALVRYGIALPLKGPYPGLRRFMAQVLKENPSLSLDAVSFGRQSVGDIGVDAQVHFTLYLRGSKR